MESFPSSTMGGAAEKEKDYSKIVHVCIDEECRCVCVCSVYGWRVQVCVCFVYGWRVQVCVCVFCVWVESAGVCMLECGEKVCVCGGEPTDMVNNVAAYHI